jgi:hypothetical protein
MLTGICQYTQLINLECSALRINVIFRASGFRAFTLKIPEILSSKYKEAFLTMAVIYTPWRKTLATVSLTSLCSLFLYSFSSLANAQTIRTHKPKLSNQQEDILKCGGFRRRAKEIRFNLPSSQLATKKPERLPVNIEGGGGRCGGGYSHPITLVALMPASDKGITKSITVAEYPTFFFYIPDVDLEGVRGELRLSNEKDEEIYRVAFSLKVPDSILMVDFSGAPSFPPLEVGKSYQWDFAIVVDPGDRSNDIFVYGEIQRVEPSSELQHKLDTALPQEKPAIYAANGIWQDTLVSLANLRCSSPNNSTMASDWASLLQQVELPEISRKPLAQCYQARVF